MKKLMIALAVVAVAAASQAAVYNWKVGTATQKVYKMNGSDTVGTANVYLFSTTDYSQDTLLKAFCEASGTAARESLLSSKSLDSNPLSGGAMTTAKSTSTLGTETDGYAHNYIAVMTTVDGKDYLYMSADVPTTIPEGTSDLAAYKAGSQTASKSAAYDAGSVFGGDTGKGAGWYQAVPEPTSGLLLLLGVAGLALRRRRA